MSFWKNKKLQDMTKAEWESLCDGCGKCCLVKLEDEATGALAYTDIACDLLDCQSCQCSDYENRIMRVEDCVSLTPETVATIGWLPSTCAYRLIEEGKDLPDWHHLICGDKNAVHAQAMSVRGRVHAQKTIKNNWGNHIIDWVITP